MDNAAAHCHGCHQYLGSNPVEFSLWIENYLGETRRDQVRARFHKPYKFYKGEKEEMLAHYKDQLEQIKKQRADGVTGYIETTSWF